jgi:hypothetical protein
MHPSRSYGFNAGRFRLALAAAFLMFFRAAALCLDVAIGASRTFLAGRNVRLNPLDVDVFALVRARGHARVITRL